MPSLITRCVALLVFLLVLLTPYTSAQDSNNTGSVFVYTQPETTEQFVFALNADSANDDLYFHMSAPAGNSWMAVGFGSQMQGTFMIVAYASSNGTGVTVSPRLGEGHREPVYTDSVQCELIYADSLKNGNTVTNPGNTFLTGAITVDAVCYNVTHLGVASLNLVSAPNIQQSMIFAVGPGLPMASDSKTASLRRHELYGHFTMDLSLTSSDANASVPLPNGSNGTYVTAGTSTATGVQADHDPAPRIHGFIMSLTYIIIFPLGALILRGLRRVIMHAVVQAVGLVLTVMATAGGVVVSLQYNKSRHFASAHQIIGFLLLCALFLQLGLGIIHHRIFKRENRPTLLGKIHRYLGPGVIVVGILNAGLGLNFAGNGFLVRPFVVIILIVAVVFAGIRLFLFYRRKNRAPKAEQAPLAGGLASEGYQPPQFTPGPPPYPASQGYFGHSAQDVPLEPYNDGYARPPFQREFSNISTTEVPLTYARPPMSRNVSAYSAGDAPVQARQML